LRDRLVAATKERDRSVQFRGDSQVSYGLVIEVMDTLKAAGIADRRDDHRAAVQPASVDAGVPRSVTRHAPDRPVSKRSRLPHVGRPPRGGGPGMLMGVTPMVQFRFFSRSKKFFEMFGRGGSQHSPRGQGAGRDAARFRGSADQWRAVEEYEHEGDKITHRIIQTLHQSGIDARRPRGQSTS